MDDPHRPLDSKHPTSLCSPTRPFSPHSPVHVSVKDDPEVGAGLAYRRRPRRHGRWVLGVRDMVGEASVGVQEAAAGRVSAQRSQDL